MNNIKTLKNAAQSSAEPIFYNTADIARLLGCSIGTAREIMYRKDFPLLKIGKNLKVNKNAFEDWSRNRHE